MIFETLLAPAYSSSVRGIGGDTAINIRPEVAGPGASAQRMWVHTPALRVFSPQTVATACRAMHQTGGGRVFQVAGTSLWEILANGSRTLRGTISSTTGPVGIASNEDQMVIVDGSAGYLFDIAANTLTLISDPEFPNGASTICTVDGYFLVEEPGSIFIRWSELRDGATWPTLSRASAEAYADIVSGVIAIGGEVWAFGTQSVQPFYNSGDVDQPWLPIKSSAIQIGTDSRQSMAIARDSIYFLGSGPDGLGRVFRTQGYNVEQISTPGIYGILSTASDLSGAVGRVHSFGGHTYYVLTVAAIEKTLVYDVDLGEWHERAWMDPSTGILSRWRGLHACFGFGKTLVGDSNSNAIYRLSDTDYKDEKPDESGDWWILRERAFGHQGAEGKMVQYLNFELHGRKGVGTVTGQGVDPVVMLSWSDDGGMTWGSSEELSVGALGQYDFQMITHLCGQGRDRMWRLRMTDPIPVAWTMATGDVRVLSR
jgi:hypothetical protein